MSDLVVSSFDDLPVCTDARESTTAYVKDEKKAYACDGADWAVDAALTESIRKIRNKKNESTKSKSGKGKGISAGSIYDAENNTLTDLRDGHVYRTVTIGDQIWMAENLNYAYPGKTFELDSSSFCESDPGEYVCDKYGRLYLWSSAFDSAGFFSTNSKGCGVGKICTPRDPVRGTCPKGWHLPMNAEWGVLLSTVAGDTQFGSHPWYVDMYTAHVLKSVDGWNGKGTDDFGFSATGSFIRCIKDSESEMAFDGAPELPDIVDKMDVTTNLTGPCKTDSTDGCEYGILIDDRDGKTYKTVTIGAYTWMAENLDYETENIKDINHVA